MKHIACNPLQPAPQSLRHGLFPGDKWILIAFAAYGCIAEIKMVVGSILYDPNIGSKSMTMNLPTILSMFWILGEGYSIPVPLPVWYTIEVLWSVGVWTIIGFLAYHFYRWLKYIPS